MAQLACLSELSGDQRKRVERRRHVDGIALVQRVPRDLAARTQCKCLLCGTDGAMLVM